MVVQRVEVGAKERKVDRTKESPRHVQHLLLKEMKKGTSPKNLCIVKKMHTMLRHRNGATGKKV
eukprot:12926869-Prorocentrum_lima.AAC.1